MAYPTLVNDQITDAVTQSSVQVLGDVPASAMGLVYQALAQAMGLSMQNAVTSQQQLNTISTAVTAQTVSSLMTIPSAASARSGDRLLSGNGSGSPPSGNAAVEELLTLLRPLIGSSPPSS